MRLFEVYQSRQRPGATGAGPDLTFEVTNDYPDKVAYADNQAFRAIGNKGNETVYSIIAPNLSSSDTRLLCSLKQELASLQLEQQRKTASDSVSAAMALASGLLADMRTDEQKELLAYLLAHEVCGHGAISMLLDDSKNIEEIVVNSATSRIGLYHIEYGYCTTNLRFRSERSFRYTVNRLIASTERELNSNVPIIDAQLEDGSRLHAQLWPYAITGAAATIRVNPSKRMDIRKLMQNGSATPELLAYLWIALGSRMNITIAGSPASGKTSLLLALSALMPRHDRIITIEEDVNELGNYSNFYNMVPLQGSSLHGRVTTMDQVINALHMRPDRIIVGEIRGREAPELMAGANLGIPFMTTMHSSADGNAILNRLGSKPMDVPRDVLSNLDVSIFLARTASLRRVASVSEYLWLQRAEAGPEDVSTDKMVRINQVAIDGKIATQALESSKVLGAYSKLYMVSGARALKELRARAAFLKGMLNQENAGLSVHDYINSYVSFDDRDTRA